MNLLEYYQKIQNIKLVGSIVISLLAVFWVFVAEQHPNPIRSCVFFTAAFGGTAWAFVQPFIQKARHLESIYYTEKR